MSMLHSTAQTVARHMFCNMDVTFRHDTPRLQKPLVAGRDFIQSAAPPPCAEPEAPYNDPPPTPYELQLAARIRKAFR